MPSAALSQAAFGNDHQQGRLSSTTATIQVRQQVNTKLFTPHHLIDDPPTAWVSDNLKKGDVLGFDPWLLTADQAERFAAACAKVGAKLIPVTPNPIDTIWEDQPKRPTASLSVQPLQFAGQSVADKLAIISKLLGKAGADATVITQPDSVAWVFNIGSHDVPYTPVVLAYAIPEKKGKAELFIDKAKLPEDVQAHFKKSVTIKKPAELGLRW
jgi:Xaa-Pro aminopeptidase